MEESSPQEGIDLLHPRILWGSALGVFLVTSITVFAWFTWGERQNRIAASREHQAVQEETSQIAIYRDTLPLRASSTSIHQ